MSDCSDYPTLSDAKGFKTNADTINEVVTSSDDRTSPAIDGQTKITLKGIESEVNSAIENTIGKSYIGTWTQGVTTFTTMNEYSDFNGITYKPKSGISLPYTAQTSDPTTAPDNANVEPFSDINSNNLSSYSPLVYYSGAGSTAVENMVSGDPIVAKVGDSVRCEYGSEFVRISDSSGDISDFKAIKCVVNDFGAVSDGLSDSFQSFSDSITVAAGAIVTAEPGEYLVDTSGVIYSEIVNVDMTGVTLKAGSNSGYNMFSFRSNSSASDRVAGTRFKWVGGLLNGQKELIEYPGSPDIDGGWVQNIANNGLIGAWFYDVANINVEKIERGVSDGVVSVNCGSSHLESALVENMANPTGFFPQAMKCRWGASSLPGARTVTFGDVTGVNAKNLIGVATQSGTDISGTVCSVGVVNNKDSYQDSIHIEHCETVNLPFVRSESTDTALYSGNVFIGNETKYSYVGSLELISCRFNANNSSNLVYGVIENVFCSDSPSTTNESVRAILYNVKEAKITNSGYRPIVCKRLGNAIIENWTDSVAIATAIASIYGDVSISNPSNPTQGTAIQVSNLEVSGSLEVFDCYRGLNQTGGSFYGESLYIHDVQSNCISISSSTEELKVSGRFYNFGLDSGLPDSDRAGIGGGGTSCKSIIVSDSAFENGLRSIRTVGGVQKAIYVNSTETNIDNTPALGGVVTHTSGVI